MPHARITHLHRAHRTLASAPTHAAQLSPANVLFFVSFLFLGVQMLLPLVLAIVVESYKEQQKDIVSKVRIHRPGMRTHTHI